MDVTEVPKRKPRGIRHDRDCYTCRKRNVKCDLNRPSCNKCVEANIKCDGYPNRIVWSEPVSKPKKHPRHHRVPDQPYDFVHVDLKSMNIAQTHPPQSSVKIPVRPKPSLELDFYEAPVTMYPQPASDVPSRAESVCSASESSESTSLSASGSAPASAITSAANSCYDEQQLPTPVKVTVVAGNSPNCLPPPSWNGKHFIWGVKAITAAFEHSKKDGTSMHTQILESLWQFVVSFFTGPQGSNGSDINQESELDQGAAWDCSKAGSEASETSHCNDICCSELWTKALSELKRVLETGSIEAIFQIMTFTYLDVCQGSFGHWHQHLHGARVLLDLHCSSLESLNTMYAAKPGLCHAVTLLCWYDVMGTFAVPDRPLIFESWHRQTMDETFFESVGCPASVFYGIAQMLESNCISDRTNSQYSSLPSSSCTTPTSPHTNKSFSSIMDSIAILLENDSSNSSADAANEVPIVCNDLKSLSASLWRFAYLLIAIVNNEPPSLAKERAIDSLVCKICYLLESYPLESSGAQHVAVVVYIAGVYAQREPHHRILRRYWKHWQHDPFPLYPDALYKCEQIWLTQNACQTNL